MIVSVLPVKTNLLHCRFHPFMVQGETSNKIQTLGNILVFAIDCDACATRKHNLYTALPKMGIDIGSKFPLAHLADRFQSGLSLFLGLRRFIHNLSLSSCG